MSKAIMYNKKSKRKFGMFILNFRLGLAQGLFGWKGAVYRIPILYM